MDDYEQEASDGDSYDDGTTATDTFSSHLLRALWSALGGSSDGTSDSSTSTSVVVLAFLMRFVSAALVLVLTRHAANAIATSFAGGSNGGAVASARRGGRPTSAAALLGRAASGSEPSPRRIPLLGRLATSPYGAGDEDGSAGASSAAAARSSLFGRSRSMAVPSASGTSSAAAAAAASAAVRQFKPLGSAPPVPDGTVAGPHYVFLVHGWLGNEQEMAYLGAALEDVVAGRAFPTNIDDSNGQQGSSNKDDKEEEGDDDGEDDFVHVTANETDNDGDGDEPQRQQQGAAASDEESQEERPDIVVHKPTCNNGRTTDGIAAGGTRLAEEVAEFIVADIRGRRRIREEGENQQDCFQEEHVTISFVGNSLGGLYSRYALSLLPSELHVASLSADDDDATSSGTIILHPNTFCTTATPHLGCSSNTYIPVPRFAERAIGRVLDVTGVDLFRADVEDYPSPQKKSDDSKGASPGKNKENVENDADGDGDGDADGEARDDEPLLPPVASNSDVDEEGSDNDAKDDAPNRDLIYRMCTEAAYLKPLSSFRRRIAYANAFGTDFQVPTNTAAFLSDKSTYPHRYCNVAEKEDLDFIASVLHTDPSDADAVRSEPRSGGDGSPEAGDDILVMTHNLDSLGWTKVFIDTRSGIPVPALPKPAFMKKLQRQSSEFDARSELRNFVTRRKSSVVGVPGASPAKQTDDDDVDQQDDMPVPESLQRRRDQRPEEVSATEEEELNEHFSSVAITLESKELVELMNPSERMHFPLGHTVMVANSKSGLYSKINAKGKPVMNKLAMDLVSQISGFD